MHHCAPLPDPWQVRDEHQHAYHLMMLRTEARRRAGLTVSPADLNRLASWLDELTARDVVVLYDPDTPDGFYLVPRRAGDTGLVREPGRP